MLKEDPLYFWLLFSSQTYTYSANWICFSFHIFAFFFLCKGNIIIFTVSAMSIVYKLHIHSVKLHILKFRWGHHSFPLKHLFSLFNQPCLGFSRKIFFFKKLLLHCSMGKKKWENSTLIHCFFSKQNVPVKCFKICYGIWVVVRLPQICFFPKYHHYILDFSPLSVLSWCTLQMQYV